MRVTTPLWVLGLVLGAVSSAAAAEQPSGNELPGVQASEQVKLLPGSVMKRGPQARFDVVVESGSNQGRRIRYAVDCDQGTIAVAALASPNDAGHMKEEKIIPPRTADWIKPAQGTKPAQWVSKACSG
jgi:hypothetical protein